MAEKKSKAKAKAPKRRAAPKVEAPKVEAPKIFSSADMTGGAPGSPTEQKIAAGSKPFEGESDTERKLRSMGLTGPGH